jgi:hypothetical protein
MIRKISWLWLPLVAVLALSVALVACGDDDGGDDDEATRQELVDLITTLATTNGGEATQEEIDFYLAHVTEGFVQDFGTESLEACEADVATCIGDPLTNPTVDAEAIEIDGDSARAEIQAEEGMFGIELARDGDTWQASGVYVPDDDIPEGAELVELGLDEFAFDADFESDAVKSGDFAFHATNNGQQPHEVVLVSLPADRPIEELLQDESFQPEPIFVKFGYGPGDDSDIALPEPLVAGRYGLVCFLPDTDDPEGTPHAFKGMVAEFTVE